MELGRIGESCFLIPYVNYIIIWAKQKFIYNFVASILN